MKRMKGKILAILMSLAMVFTMMPMMTGTVHAATPITVDGIKYILNNDNTAAVASNQNIYITGRVTIPSTINADGVSYSVTSINEVAFDYCTGMTGIIIPSSVTSIGKGAFSRCSSLDSITIPSSVTSIGEDAFSRCSSLTSITIPSSVTSIGGGTFLRCSSLDSITIPSSVTSIGEEAFYGCSSLDSIDIPSSVTSIGEYAFARCSSLESIDIPSSVTSIGKSAFEGCSSLESITIPSSVTSIGEDAFTRCSSLTSINIDCNFDKALFDGTRVFPSETDDTFVIPLDEGKTTTGAFEYTHTWSTEWSSDGNNHWHECSACGEKKDEVTHICNTEWSADGNNHWHECSICGAHKDEAAHSGGTATCKEKAKCETCNEEYGNLGQHKYGPWTKFDDKQHQRVCEHDDTHVEKENHTWSTEWSADGNNHWHECTVCHMKKDEDAHNWSLDWITDGENHWHECTVCHTKKDEEAHTMSTKWSTDGDNHWHECTACGERKDEAAHTWNTEWSTDGDNHWHECSACGEKKDETVHAWVDATCTEAKTCEICDTTEGDPLGHKYGEWTNFDINQHQRVCEHDKSHVIKENHKWDGGKVTREPTETAEGEKTFTCDVCETTRTESVPKLEPKATPIAKATAKGKTSLTFGWAKVEGADGYDIFFSRCDHKGKKITMKNVKTIKGNKIFSYTKKGLKKKTAYKAYVKAYVMKDGKKTYISKSPDMHAYTGGLTKKYTNAKAVKVNKTKVTLTQGKNFKVKAKVIKLKKNKKLMPKGHVAKIRYMSSDKTVATVSKSGKITAKGKGTCNIVVFAHNGVSKSIKVTVP